MRHVTKLRDGLGALGAAVWRMLPWRALGTAAVTGLVPLAVARLDAGRPGPLAALLMLRCAALALALGVGFLLDDPARHTTAAVPVGRGVRAVLRAALAVPFLALCWTAALLLVPGPVRPPYGGVTLEAAAACALGLAAATVAGRLTDEPEPGRTVVAALLTTALLAPFLLPHSWGLFTTPADPGWAGAHQRWAWLLAGALAVGAVALREPLRRRAGALRSRCGTSGRSRTS
ncbi:ABC transporter [Streptomyces sp. NPDC127190]|uniref:ABC transporter n=1 Tax=unclassified Streptomyces TaxID=2593676 RepID=UPI0036428A63